MEKEKRIKEFRDIVGPIVFLVEPLTSATLAKLPQLRKSDIDGRLRCLRSVLHLPSTSEDPIRPLHLSFRDFLTDSERRTHNPFWIDEKEAHTSLAIQCLGLLSTTTCLKQDICSVKKPGTLRNDYDDDLIAQCLPREVQYACLHWVYHLENGCCLIGDHSQVHVFLENRFLYWLEALGLMGKTYDAINMITILQTLLQVRFQQRFLYVFYWLTGIRLDMNLL